MAPTYATNAVALDASGPNNTWVKSNPLRFSSHGSSAPGTASSGVGSYSYQQAWFGGSYIGSVNTSVPNLLWSRLAPVGFVLARVRREQQRSEQRADAVL